MKTIAIYPGRFQPFSLNHLAVWEHIINSTLFDECFIATSDKIDLRNTKNNCPRSPFSFYQKQRFAELLGVHKDNFRKCRMPYVANEILSNFNPDKDAVVYIVGQQDMISKNGKPPRFQVGKSVDGVKKNGEPTYFKMFDPAIKLLPFVNHGYIMMSPQVYSQLPDKSVSSGTNTRIFLRDCSNNNFNKLYPGASTELFDKIKLIFS